MVYSESTRMSRFIINHQNVVSCKTQHSIEKSKYLLFSFLFSLFFSFLLSLYGNEEICLEQTAEEILSKVCFHMTTSFCFTSISKRKSISGLAHRCHLLYVESMSQIQNNETMMIFCKSLLTTFEASIIFEATKKSYSIES